MLTVAESLFAKKMTGHGRHAAEKERAGGVDGRGAERVQGGALGNMILLTTNKACRLLRVWWLPRIESASSQSGKPPTATIDVDDGRQVRDGRCAMPRWVVESL